MATLRPKRRLAANLRYLWALIRRFKVTLVMASAFFALVPLLFVWLYPQPISYGLAQHHVYFLLFGQPSLPYVDLVPVQALNLLIPPLGILIVVDGVVRFAYLFFAKHRADKEWIAVIAESLKDHVIVCGAGRVGYRVATQLLALKRDVVVVDKNEEAMFVTVLRDEHVPVLIDNVKSPQTLTRLNVARASALVAATDDDLANLNIALDARRLNPSIRLVIRLFDDDLVEKVRDNFAAEALSSSALAAPALALAALDPRIVHSFQVGPHLMVVSRFVAQKGLPDLKVSEVRDDHGGLTLSIRNPGGEERLNPAGHTQIARSDVLTLQSTYESYLRLRELTGESTPPLGGNFHAQARSQA